MACHFVPFVCFCSCCPLSVKGISGLVLFCSPNDMFFIPDPCRNPLPGFDYTEIAYSFDNMQSTPESPYERNEDQVDSLGSSNSSGNEKSSQLSAVNTSEPPTTTSTAKARRLKKVARFNFRARAERSSAKMPKRPKSSLAPVTGSEAGPISSLIKVQKRNLPEPSTLKQRLKIAMKIITTRELLREPLSSTDQWICQFLEGLKSTIPEICPNSFDKKNAVIRSERTGGKIVRSSARIYIVTSYTESYTSDPYNCAVLRKGQEQPPCSQLCCETIYQNSPYCSPASVTARQCY